MSKVDEDPTELMNQTSQEILTELRDMKRLLVLLLLKGGSTQKEIAAAMGVGQATVSRLGIRSEESFVVRMENGEEE